MALGRLTAIYDWINKLNPNVKTLLIIGLAIWVLHSQYKESVFNLLNEHQERVEAEKAAAEEYTISIAKELNSNLESILKQDLNATNVLLLNYHNNVSSTNGLSYRYLTALTEKTRGFDTKSCIRVWKELEYINYSDEIRKINRNGYLELDSLSQGKQYFPKLTELLELSGAKSAGIYPIMGIKGPIGLIIVIYHESITHELNYYKKAIAPYIQPIGTLLDYDSIKEKYTDYAS